MSDALRPTAGARFLLERQAEHATGATYRATIFTPTETFTYAAELGLDGSHVVTPLGQSDHEDALVMLARLTARGAAGKQAEGMPPWPARILRWRGPGRGT